MNEILGTPCIVLLVIAYAERARGLGCELRALCEDMAGGEAGLLQGEDLDAELIAPFARVQPGNGGGRVVVASVGVSQGARLTSHLTVF